MGEQQGIVCCYGFSFPPVLQNSISTDELVWVFLNRVFCSLHNIWMGPSLPPSSLRGRQKRRID